MPTLRLLEEYYSGEKLVTFCVLNVDLSDPGAFYFSDVREGFHIIQSKIVLKNVLDLLKDNKYSLADDLKNLEEGNPNIQLLRNVVSQRSIEYLADLILSKQKTLICSEIEKKYKWKTLIIVKNIVYLSWADVNTLLAAVEKAIRDGKDVLVTVKVDLDTGKSESKIH